MAVWCKGEQWSGSRKAQSCRGHQLWMAQAVSLHLGVCTVEVPVMLHVEFHSDWRGLQRRHWKWIRLVTSIGRGCSQWAVALDWMCITVCKLACQGGTSWQGCIPNMELHGQKMHGQKISKWGPPQERQELRGTLMTDCGGADSSGSLQLSTSLCRDRKGLHMYLHEKWIGTGHSAGWGREVLCLERYVKSQMLLC